MLHLNHLPESGNVSAMQLAKRAFHGWHVRFLFLLWLLMASWMFQACGPGRLLSPVTPERRAVDQLVSSMHAGQADYTFFAARFSGMATLDDTQMNIAGNIRIRKDSAIFISVAPVLGVEVFRILVTPGEVKMLNRLESTYFIGSMQLINNMLNANLDYYMLQAMLTGNDLDHFDSHHFRMAENTNNLVLNAENRKRPRTDMYDSALIEQNIWLDDKTFKIVRTNIFEREANRSIQVQYDQFTSLQGQLIPSSIRLVFIDASSRADLDIGYSRMSLNQPQLITFDIPSRYQRAE